MIGGVAGILIAFYLGFFFLSPFMKNSALAFRILFSVPLGFSLTSFLYFLFMIFNIYNFSFYRSVELVLLVLAGIFYYFKNEQEPVKIPEFSRPLFWSCSAAVIFYLRYFINNTLGSWDGFRIWNIKAEFLYQYSDVWRNVFKLPHFMMHNDYPLFLPCTTARIWKYAGVDSTDLNLITGLIFTFSIIFLLYFTVKKYKNKKLADVVCSILALTVPFITNGASQASDIPLSMFILSSAVALLFFIDERKTIYIFLAVLFSGLSAWVKNEGMMYFLILVMLAVILLIYLKEYKKIIAAGVSVLISACVLFLMKNTAKAPNDLYSGLILLKTYKHLWQIDYYIIIIKHLIKSIFWNFSMAFAYVLLFIPGIKTEKKAGVFVLWSLIFLMSAGYFTVYLLSPHDMDWILKNSIERIILHIYPVFILTLALCMKLGEKDRAN